MNSGTGTGADTPHKEPAGETVGSGDGRPRFEFRVWADQLADLSDRIRSVGVEVATVESSETYVVSVSTSTVNPKVREASLDIKDLIQTRDGFEQWDVRLKAPFPIDASVLREELLAPLGVVPPPLKRSAYSLQELIDDIVAPHDDLAVAYVTKDRSIYDVGGCSAEVSAVRIDDRSLQTVAVESADLDALRIVHERLGLKGFDNLSYPRMIRRVVGGRFAEQ